MLTFLSLAFLLVSCFEKKESSIADNEEVLPLEVPEIIRLKSELQFNTVTSLWTLDEKPYSGFMVSYYPDSSLMEKVGMLEGKKQNEAIQWYNDGHLKNSTTYHQGKLHGEKKTWSTDYPHVLIAHYNFYKGQAHGEQTKWYRTGELFTKLNMVNGKEEGIQQAYRKNGALYANYEARNGRIFGLKKTALCFGLENQKMKSRE